LYVDDPPETLGIYLALFADDTCVYTTDREEGSQNVGTQPHCRRVVMLLEL